MPRAEKDEIREERITMEIIVDTYGSEEQAMGWYYYLEENLAFPFKARCIKKRSISPLTVGQEFKVVKMAAEDDCMLEMFVNILWAGRTLAVPLMQLEPIVTDEKTREAIEDWHYWIAHGYVLG